MEDNRKAAIYALIACLIWGSVYVAIKVGIDHGLKPLTFAGVRFLGGGLILLLIAWWKGSLRITFRDLLVLSAFGFFQTGVQNACFFIGVGLTNAGIAAIFINTAPFFVMVFAPFFFSGSRLTFARAAGVIIGFAGVIVTSMRHGLINPGYELGVAALIGAAITWAGSNIAVKKIMEGRDTLTVTGVQMTSGALPLLALGMLREGNGLAGADMAGLSMLAYLILFATALPFFLWFRAIRLGEVGKVSIFAFTLPVLGVLSGWLLLGEPVNANILLGMLMVAAGIFIVNSRA